MKTVSMHVFGDWIQINKLFLLLQIESRTDLSIVEQKWRHSEFIVSTAAERSPDLASWEFNCFELKQLKLINKHLIIRCRTVRGSSNLRNLAMVNPKSTKKKFEITFLPAELLNLFMINLTNRKIDVKSSSTLALYQPSKTKAQLELVVDNFLVDRLAERAVIVVLNEIVVKHLWSIAVANFLSFDDDLSMKWILTPTGCSLKFNLTFSLIFSHRVSDVIS